MQWFLYVRPKLLKLACKKFQIQKRGTNLWSLMWGNKRGNQNLSKILGWGGTKPLHTMPSEVSFNLISKKHTKYLTNLHIIRIFFNPISLLCIIRYPACFLFHGVHQNTLLLENLTSTFYLILGYCSLVISAKHWSTWKDIFLREKTLLVR